MKKLFALLLAVAMLMSAAVSFAEVDPANVQETLVIGTAQDVNNMEPYMQNDQINNNVICLTHQSLIMLANDASETGITYMPMLAKEWGWEDDNTLVFYLRDGVHFSDGTLMTADDVVFTYETAMDPSSHISGVLSLITSVEARDDLTFVIHTSAYSNELTSNIASKSLSILSRAAYESGMDEPYLIGTGQYKLKERVEGQYVELERVEDYWGIGYDSGDDYGWIIAPGNAKTVIFKPILEAASRVIALQNGEIDVCIDPPTTELQFLEDDPNVTVLEAPGTRLFYFGFNCEKAPFDNKTLRQAVASAIDKDTILQVVLSGKGLTQNTVLNRGVWSFYNEDDLGAYTYDVDRAKELMAEAGVNPGELTVDLYSATDDPYKTIAPIIQANLAVIGINVNIVSLDQATLKSECQAGNHQIFLWRWNVLDRLDEVYSELFSTGFATNYHHFSDPYVDEMAVEILTQKDESIRYDESVELQKYLAEESPQVPLYVANLVIAYRNGLSETYLFGGGNHNWAHAYIDLSAK
ncbi:MAG: ABC transporter substrate-binding protein [Clostridia bacterium]|nr:ABC transporter substrate-binding protein [Clostridia bacterium]